MQGNRMEDGAVVSRLVDGKLVEDPTALGWTNEGTPCRCGAVPTGTIILSKDLILLNGPEHAEEFIAEERAKQVHRINTLGGSCKNCGDWDPPVDRPVVE